MNVSLKHLSEKFKKIKYLTKLEQIPQLTEKEREEMQKVNDRFVFRTNDYYQSLIDSMAHDRTPAGEAIQGDENVAHPWCCTTMQVTCIRRVRVACPPSISSLTTEIHCGRHVDRAK